MTEILPEQLEALMARLRTDNEQKRIIENKAKPIPNIKKSKQNRLIEKKNSDGTRQVQYFFAPLFKRPDNTTVFCWTNEVYNWTENRFLEGKSIIERGLQNAIIDGEFNGDVAKWILNKMITDGSIYNCSKDTFRLIADVLAGKITKKGKGRAKMKAGEKNRRDVKLIFGIKNELKKRSDERRNEFEPRVATKFGVSSQEIKHIMNLYGIRVADYRKEERKKIFDAYKKEKNNKPDESSEQNILTVVRRRKISKEDVKKAVRFCKTSIRKTRKKKA